MAVQHDVIDLDRLDEPARRAARFSVRRIALLVAVFTAGLLVGGAAVDGWRDHLTDRAQDAEISLVVRPATANLGGSGNAVSVRLSGSLLIFNAGPRPVKIREARAERPDVRVSSYGQQPLAVLPGATGQFLVELEFGCPVAFPADALPVRLSVETADGQVREVVYDIPSAETEWQREAVGMCDLQPPGR